MQAAPAVERKQDEEPLIEPLSQGSSQVISQSNSQVKLLPSHLLSFPQTSRVVAHVKNPTATFEQAMSRPDSSLQNPYKDVKKVVVNTLNAGGNGKLRNTSITEYNQ